MAAAAHGVGDIALEDNGRAVLIDGHHGGNGVAVFVGDVLDLVEGSAQCARAVGFTFFEDFAPVDGTDQLSSDKADNCANDSANPECYSAGQIKGSCVPSLD